MIPMTWLPLRKHRRRPGWHFPRLPRWISTPLILALAALLAWPYLNLWRLNLAVLEGPPEALAGLVDLDAVRDEIRRRLNKDAHSTIGEVSDPFIEWIERGIRETGQSALEEQVTLAWLRDLLLARSGDNGGFLTRISYAFFVAPNALLVRVGEVDTGPVYLRLQPAPIDWRVTAVYY